VNRALGPMDKSCLVMWQWLWKDNTSERHRRALPGLATQGERRDGLLSIEEVMVVLVVLVVVARITMPVRVTTHSVSCPVLLFPGGGQGALRVEPNGRPQLRPT
jgi:hypothetical protein